MQNRNLGHTESLVCLYSRCQEACSHTCTTDQARNKPQSDGMRRMFYNLPHVTRGGFLAENCLTHTRIIARDDISSRAPVIIIRLQRTTEPFVHCPFPVLHSLRHGCSRFFCVAQEISCFALSEHLSVEMFTLLYIMSYGKPQPSLR